MMIIIIITRNTCIAEPRKPRGKEGPCLGWKGERIGANCVAVEGSFQH